MSSPLQIFSFANGVPILPCSGLLSPISLDVRTLLSQLRKDSGCGAITSVLDLSGLGGNLVTIDNHLARFRQDMRDDVAANYASYPVNHALGDAPPSNSPRSPSSNDSDSGNY